MRLHLVFASLLAGGTAAAQPPVVKEERAPRTRDVVERWNDEALAAIRAAKTPPPVAARNLALVHVAIYDAVVAIEGGYSPFYFAAPAARGADAAAAASAAAHRTLLALYPERLRGLDRALNDTLGARTYGEARDRGVLVGLSVADRVLRWRAKDTEVRKSAYTPREAVGRWRPTPPDHRAPLLPEWGAVTCFAVADGAHFRPPEPPALNSREYAESYRKVKALGGKTSRERTREQTEIDRAFLGRRGGDRHPAGALEPDRAVGRGGTQAQPRRASADVRTTERGDGGCGDGVLGLQVPLRLLAAGDGDSRRGPGLDAAHRDSAFPVVHVGAQFLQRGGGRGAGGILREG
jgi:hypothetical protein